MAAPTPPALPALEPVDLGDANSTDELVLAEALVERHGRGPITTPRVHIAESDVRGLALTPGPATEFVLRDARLHDCDLSNLSARRGEIRRTELIASRLVGFALADGDVQDVRVTGGTLMLGSLARCTLRRVCFDQVNLREATFLDSRLTGVVFSDCDLTGADFRGARLKDCVISGSSLDGVIGVESLRGVAMPWPDLVASVEALADALGIVVHTE